MAESKELKKIKKMYGENFMKLCRELFPTLLEQEGLLTEILTSSFSANSRTLYEDIMKNGLEDEFKNFIYNKVDVEKETPEIIEEKTPYELMEEAGYDLYECTTEEEIQKFKRYYKKGEELCTFVGGRLSWCVVFWAVKKDAEDIKREDFKNPKREDEYGTSVMGIQFNKTGKCTVSIKNRYNHTVNNPDATYGNDLDKIIPGLEKSFATLLQKEHGLELNSTNIENFQIPGYTVANNGKYYKFNMERNGIYYCPGNIIIENGEPKQLENPEAQILIDYFILDMKNKTIKLYDDKLEDSFIDYFENLEETDAKIKIEKNKEKGTRKITIQKSKDKSITIEIDKNNEIIGYNNPNLKKTGDNFLGWNIALNQLEVPNLKSTGDNFLGWNKALNQLEAPNLKSTGNAFLWANEGLTQLIVPKLKKTGYIFLGWNKALNQLEAPNLKSTGDNFLSNNQGLTQLILPNLKKTGDNFLSNNIDLNQLEAPNLESTGDYFLWTNQGLTQLEIPKLPELSGKFSKIIEKNLEEQKNKNGQIINSESIAKLDKKNKLTTTETNIAKKIIEKIRDLFRKKDEKER